MHTSFTVQSMGHSLAYRRPIRNKIFALLRCQPAQAKSALDRPGLELGVADLDRRAQDAVSASSAC